MRVTRQHELRSAEVDGISSRSQASFAALRRSLRRGRSGRRRGWAALCVVLVVSLASAGLSVSPTSAQSSEGPLARVWARRLASGNVEFGVAVYAAGSSSAVNVSVTNRYFPYANAGSNVGSWYNSEAVILRSGSDSTLASIRARRLASGNLEFALRVYGIDDQVWTPRARYFIYESAAIGSVAYSSPFNMGQHDRVCLDGAVTSVASNLGLFRDCEVLASATGALEGDTGVLSSLNSWGTRQGSVPQLPWTGITLENNRVTELYIGAESWCPTGTAWEQGTCDPANQIKFAGIQSDYMRALVGTIPGVMGSLSGLEKLWIDKTDTEGQIPPELGNLTNLKELRFSNLALRSSIPPELGKLRNLEKLELDHLKWRPKGRDSGLMGSIPAELGNLINLKELHLQVNHLRGEIPAELGNLSNLERISFHTNQLSGEIPEELKKLTNLKQLHLNANNLTGAIPSWLGDLTKLEKLALGWNNLSGTIPEELGKLAPSEGGSITEISFRGGRITDGDSAFGGAYPGEDRLNNPNLTGCIPASLNHPEIEVQRGGLEFCTS